MLPNGQLGPAEALPLEKGHLDASREYVTDEYAFEPAFRFKLTSSKYWHSWSQPKSTEGIWIVKTWPERGYITFSRPSHVFDPSNPSAPKEVRAPQDVDEWVSWFQSHPNLDTSVPVPVMVGGEPGLQIDVTTSSTPKNYSKDLCGDKPCVPLYPSSESVLVTFAETIDRFVIVDVGDEPVVINVTARAGMYNEFLPDAQKVLDTVKWESE